MKIDLTVKDIETGTIVIEKFLGEIVYGHFKMYAGHIREAGKLTPMCGSKVGIEPVVNNIRVRYSDDDVLEEYRAKLGPVCINNPKKEWRMVVGGGYCRTCLSHLHRQSKSRLKIYHKSLDAMWPVFKKIHPERPVLVGALAQISRHGTIDLDNPGEVFYAAWKWIEANTKIKA